MKVYYKSVLLISGILLSLLPGCVKEQNDNTDCPDALGVELSFYSRTPCQTENSYPENVDNILITLFDKNGILKTHFTSNAIDFQSNYTQQIDVESGFYSAIVWAGLNDTNYNINQIQDGITTKNDLLFRLKRNGNEAYSLNGSRLFQGENPAIYVEESLNPVWEKAAINLLEITNRINITVAGLDLPDNYEVILESGNGSMNIDASIANDDLIEYTSTTESENKYILEAFFTTLKLETGNNNTIVIRNKNTGTEIFQGNLLGTLLLKNPDVNLSCDHDFTINFTAEDRCACGTYTITEIWVNNWLIHTYDTNMNM